jgi:Sec-independent protein translocase protein TatA
MDLLGVGPLELVFIFLIIFLVLGPNDIAETGKKIGRFLNTVRKSEFWQGVTQVSKEVRTLPNTLMREAQLEETKKELEQDLNEVRQVAKEFDVQGVRELEKDLKKNLQVDLNPPAPTDSTPEPKPEQSPESAQIEQETPTEEEAD